jgi:hypothetical protein
MMSPEAIGILALDPIAAGVVNAILLLVALVAFAGLAVVYDWWAMKRWGNTGTISVGMRRLGAFSPMIPFLIGIFMGLVIGVLAGHFWFCSGEGSAS